MIPTIPMEARIVRVLTDQPIPQSSALMLVANPSSVLEAQPAQTLPLIPTDAQVGQMFDHAYRHVVTTLQQQAQPAPTPRLGRTPSLRPGVFHDGPHHTHSDTTEAELIAQRQSAASSPTQLENITPEEDQKEIAIRYVMRLQDASQYAVATVQESLNSAQTTEERQQLQQLIDDLQIPDQAFGIARAIALNFPVVEKTIGREAITQSEFQAAHDDLHRNYPERGHVEILNYYNPAWLTLAVLREGLQMLDRNNEEALTDPNDRKSLSESVTKLGVTLREQVGTPKSISQEYLDWSGQTREKAADTLGLTVPKLTPQQAINLAIYYVFVSRPTLEGYAKVLNGQPVTETERLRHQYQRLFAEASQLTPQQLQYLVKNKRNIDTKDGTETLELLEMIAGGEYSQDIEDALVGEMQEMKQDNGKTSLNAAYTTSVRRGVGVSTGTALDEPTDAWEKFAETNARLQRLS